MECFSDFLQGIVHHVLDHDGGLAVQVGGGPHMERLEEVGIVEGRITGSADHIRIFQSTVLPIAGDHERHIVRNVGTDYRNIVTQIAPILSKSAQQNMMKRIVAMMMNATIRATAK